MSDEGAPAVRETRADGLHRRGFNKVGRNVLATARNGEVRQSPSLMHREPAGSSPRLQQRP
ncbi:hypothetical protein [Nannocystis radixulma]|uniref:Uncharacterized protein n=1 Tax=Nannocystis radixulma TaxID=2995305 RepID=A0ABT5B798_9BACT|nr:hypothetical protein [Nannocystis radixulma]MDC0669603.1 hypothetical protein [Nannocystis radixulma]